MFEKGTYVVYGKTGVCCVEGCEEMAFSGTDKAMYYVLRPHRDASSRVYVPRDNEMLMSRMRPIFTKEEIDDLLRGARLDEVEWIEDKNERMIQYRAILTQGDRRRLVCLVRRLFEVQSERVASGKKLSAADEQLLKECVRLVEEEFSIVLGISSQQVDKYIRTIVEEN